MKKENLLSVLIFLSLYSCQQKAENTPKQQTEIVKKEKTAPTSKPFFKFDEIEHYTVNFDAENLGQLYDNKSNSKLDETKLGVITNEIPKDINDTIFMGSLDKMGYQKKEIPKSKFTEIDNIFSEKPVNGSFVYACIPVYRDLLVFKFKNKISGIAKICFECRKDRIHGTKRNTENFGQDGDYEKLNNILHQRKIAVQ